MENFPGRILSERRAQSFLSEDVWSRDTFIDVMEKNVRQFGHLLHKDDKQSLSYSELWAESESIAAHLYELGVRKGDKVAIQLPTSLDFVVALFGATRIGAAAVLLQADLGRQSVADSLRQSKSTVLIVAHRYKGIPLADTAESLSNELPDLHTILVRGKLGIPEESSGIVKRVPGDPVPPSYPVLPGNHAVPGVNVRPSVRILSFDDCRVSGERLSEAIQTENRPEALDPFVMVFTAGTTGSPKGIVHLHANALWAARTYSDLYHMQDGEAMLCLAPLYHLTGFLIGIMMPVAKGSRILLIDRFAAKRALQCISEDKPNYIVGAPPHLMHIAKEPKLRQSDVSSVKMFFYAGAPVPSEVLRQLQVDTGWIVGGMFGWSEGFLATATRSDDPVEAINQTVGWVIPGTEVKLVDDHGKLVPQGHIGEIWCRGPSFSAGYYYQPEAAREKWDEDGWFHSGDLLRQDEAGRFVYKGRADNIINRGGTKIDPREVEVACEQHPAVQTVAVFGIPDTKLGHRTAAAFVLKPEARQFTPDELRNFLAGLGLAQYQYPDKIVFFERPVHIDADAFGTDDLLQMATASMDESTHAKHTKEGP